MPAPRRGRDGRLGRGGAVRWGRLVGDGFDIGRWLVAARASAAAVSMPRQATDRRLRIRARRSARIRPVLRRNSPAARSRASVLRCVTGGAGSLGAPSTARLRRGCELVDQREFGRRFAGVRLAARSHGCRLPGYRRRPLRADGGLRFDVPGMRGRRWRPAAISATRPISAPMPTRCSTMMADADTASRRGLASARRRAPRRGRPRRDRENRAAGARRRWRR